MRKSTRTFARTNRTQAFTIVELLVSIAIIGMIAALTMPAVQRTRESARQTECKNNLRQIAVACMAHVQAHKHLPSGGWGWRWMGDPDRGFNQRQPGGWIYNLLPYIEQQSLRKKGAGLPEAQKRLEGREVAETPLLVFNCPSRRIAEVYPFVHRENFVNIERPRFMARSDYAGNVGDLKPTLYGPGPASLAEGDAKTYRWRQLDRTGIVFRRSMIQSGHVRDGMSQTYLVAEAYLDRKHYRSGEASNDNQGMFVGYDRDTLRVTHPDWPPMRDREGLRSDHSFGSAHTEGFHAAFCDGAVRKIGYAIQPEVHRRLGNRADRQPVDMSTL
jgi:prepilin-type N-terminal cleavage/methylation domain-containing protein